MCLGAAGESCGKSWRTTGNRYKIQVEQFVHVSCILCVFFLYVLFMFTDMASIYIYIYVYIYILIIAVCVCVRMPVRPISGASLIFEQAVSKDGMSAKWSMDRSLFHWWSFVPVPLVRTNAWWKHVKTIIHPAPEIQFNTSSPIFHSNETVWPAAKVCHLSTQGGTPTSVRCFLSNRYNQFDIKTQGNLDSYIRHNFATSTFQVLNRWFNLF